MCSPGTSRLRQPHERQTRAGSRGSKALEERPVTGRETFLQMTSRAGAVIAHCVPRALPREMVTLHEPRTKPPPSFSFYRGANQDTRRINNSSKVTRLVCSRARN